MRWKFGNFEFNQHTHVLSNKGRDTLLEPKTAALLSYFLQNTQKDISRDELLEHVWDGQIVSENAINRVVVRLRKALGDDGKVKTFIVTIPKTGYRFVAATQKIDEGHAATPVRARPRAITTALSIALIFAVLIWWALDKPTPPTTQMNANVSPLVRLSGEQFDGAMSHSNSLMVYSHLQGEHMPLYLVGAEGLSPQLISPETGTSKNAFWLPDDSAVVYQHESGQRCEFHIVEFAQNLPQKPRPIYECQMESEASFAAKADGRLIYFTERENEFSPYKVYALNPDTGTKQQIQQPLASGLGNYHLDMHPTSGRLLLLSAEAPGQTSAFAVNVEAGSHQKIHEFDYRVDYAVWGHNPNTVVHMGEHPSYQLVKTNIATKETTVLVKDSRRITEPKRVNNGKDYHFRSFLVNRDIALDGVAFAELNSSVRDYLPVFSNDGEKLAFISKRAGYSQVWVKDYQTGRLFPIEVKDKGRIYRGLSWSPDDRKLAANTDAGIILIDIASKETSQTIKFALPTYAVQWSDNSKLSYSQYAEGRWDHYEYDPLVSVSTPHPKSWAFSIKTPEETFFVDQKMQLRRASGTLLDTQNCSPPIVRSTLTFRFANGKLYCRGKGSNTPTSLFLLVGDSFKHYQYLPRTAGTNFSISDDKIAVSILSSVSGDIMRTNFGQ